MPPSRRICGSWRAASPPGCSRDGPAQAVSRPGASRGLRVRASSSRSARGPATGPEPPPWSVRRAGPAR
jgi:hypothetical protein